MRSLGVDYRCWWLTIIGGRVGIWIGRGRSRVDKARYSCIGDGAGANIVLDVNEERRSERREIRKENFW